MKVMLINPLSGYFKYDSMSMPPLGALYVANQLREEGHEVSLLDRNSYLFGTLACVGQPSPQLFEQLDKWTRQEISRQQPDVIGVTMMTCQMKDVKHVTGMARKIAGQDIILVAGGYHPTTVDSVGLLKEIPELDIAVTGRGEWSMADIAAGHKWEDVAGITYHHRPRATFTSRLKSVFKSPNGHGIEVFQTPNQPFDRNRVLPGRPARDLLDKSYYSKSGETTISCYYFRRPASIVTSIGCPWDCSFCASKIMEPKMAFRPVDDVVDEIQMLIEKDGVSGLFFYDINFLAWQKRAKELIRAFIDTGINEQIKWLACASAINFPYDMLPELREAGCIGLVFGLESASQKILHTLNKGPATPELNQKAVTACKENDIRPQSGFILGVPGETEKDVDKTFEFIAKNDLLSSLNVLLPLPGTAVNRQLISTGKLDPNHPDYWGLIADTNAPLIPERVFSNVPYERFVELYNYGMANICAPTWKTIYIDSPKGVNGNINQVHIPEFHLAIS